MKISSKRNYNLFDCHSDLSRASFSLFPIFSLFKSCITGGFQNFKIGWNLIFLFWACIRQDEWVVCRVFQKSAGAKKFPTNQSRAVNPAYNLDTGASVIPPQMIQAENFQFPVGRNYTGNADQLAEFTRMFRGGASSSVNNNFPIQSQMNYPLAGGFTISGLNLNLGGATTQPVLRPMPPPPPHPQAMHQEEVTCSMMTSSAYAADQSLTGYAAEINQANGAAGGSRYMSLEHCMDLDSYWPPY